MAAVSDLFAAADGLVLQLVSLFVVSLRSFSPRLVSRSWNEILCQHAALWEHLTRARFPNLSALPPRATPSGREGFLRRCWMLRDDTAAVRPVLWPAALRARPQWAGRRGALTFLLDVSIGGVRVLSEAARCRVNESGAIVREAGFEQQPPRLVQVLDERGETTHISAIEADENLGEVEVELRDPSKLAAVEALSRRMQASGAELFTFFDVQVMLSFHLALDGEKKEKRSETRSDEPVCLLNEFSNFFFHKPELSDDEDFEDPGEDLVFRTDVAACWPSHDSVRSGRAPTDCVDGKDYGVPKLNHKRLCDLRYGCGALDFDPQVKLTLSRRDQDRRFTQPSEFVVGNAEGGESTIRHSATPLIRGDRRGSCWMRAEISVADGELDGLRGVSFSRRVLPGLLALWAAH